MSNPTQSTPTPQPAHQAPPVSDKPGTQAAPGHEEVKPSTTEHSKKPETAKDAPAAVTSGKPS